MAQQAEDTKSSEPVRGSSVASGEGVSRSVPLVIIFLGLGLFVWKMFYGPSLSTAVVSFLLCLLGTWALAEKIEKKKMALFVPLLLFSIWYFLFNRTVDPTNLLYLVLVFGVLSVILGFFTHGESVQPELYGLLPVVFFFLDIGLLEFLKGQLGLVPTPLLTALIQDIPWWVLFGVLTLPGKVSEKEGVNFAIDAFRIFAILYVVFVLVAPTLPAMTLGKDSVIPGVGQLQQAQAAERAKLHTESSFVSSVKCVFVDGTYDNIPGCVAERQKQVELGAICEQERKIQPDTPAFEKCKEDEQKRKERELLSVSGVNDPTISKPTTIMFVQGNYFPKSMVKMKGQPLKVSYPVEFKVDNPRKQEIAASFSCKFVQGQSEIMGEITSGVEQKLAGETISKTVVCQPPVGIDLQGNYNLMYMAELRGLTSRSRLQRVFIPVIKDVQAEAVMIKDIEQAHFGGGIFGGGNAVSQAPPDLARINFAFGNPLENPIIKPGNDLIVSSSIENTGNGKITRILEYQLKLGDAGLSVVSGSDASCLQGAGLEVPDQKMLGKQTVYLPTCFVALPKALQELKEYELREFEAEVRYDYMLTQTFPIQVNVVATT